MLQLQNPGSAENSVPLGKKGRSRTEDWEMRVGFHKKVTELRHIKTTENLPALRDLEKYKNHFCHLFGSDIKGVDYEKETKEMTQIESILWYTNVI